MPLTYVTGHRNPDTDSIAAAIGYAELRARLDPDTTYLPVRLGDLNAQTRWVLDRAGAAEPDLLPHIMLRVRDVMQQDFYAAGVDDAVREVGLTMAADKLDVVPIVDHDGKLVGVMTERALARRYIRESREASSLVDTPTRVSAIASAVSGEQIVGEDVAVAGRVWVFAMEVDFPESGIGEGDVVVLGNREDAQRRMIERGVALMLVSNGSTPSDEILKLANEAGTAVVVSPLDSYVCGRMTTLAAPCRALMDAEPLTVRGNDLLEDVTDDIKNVHYRSAIAVDRRGHPIGLVTRTDLVNPTPRDVILVDHAEQGQSVTGIEQAHIVEILDHHHIGSIETRLPVRATFDPVGSTSTLVLERFQQAREEPTKPTATVLLGAILSDTVILNSPTTTERDRVAVRHLEELLGLDALKWGREMFESGSDAADAPVEALLGRDLKEYETADGPMCIAQVETAGKVLVDRLGELREALQVQHDKNGHVLSALMVTDILEKHTSLLVAGDVSAAERAFGTQADEGVLELPGVMSRKKQVAPQLLGAF
ncbi:MAG TPA: putative manganese-dependent inorganic diphosphatase [Baekduia sp.]|uniref:putative manganese-dependent inorganic diphosphatase n=1 Tax=Baekduia sp. TaxID=2600305 RepID=UPI002D769D9A|nr:putative manganese-dependent inorganic diphosphatase [Baekduia sp.]HET6507555.1 putative manganese-dependent inorganic diphosphatase [Baekduia sp.]